MTDHDHTPQPKPCAASGCRELATQQMVLDRVPIKHAVTGVEYEEAYVWRDVCPTGHKIRPRGMRP